jgi:ribosomal protein L11 methyltransferase
MDVNFDIILANINKNVILDNFDILAKQLSPGGFLLLSGLLVEDEQDILAASARLNLLFLNNVQRHNWLLLKLSR